MSGFHPLIIVDKKQETPNAVSIAFEVPDTLRDKFQFKAGQYLTIRHPFNGEEIRRSYSLCSSEFSGEWRIGIKRMENGTFSAIANDTLRVGDVLEVMPPQGLFILNTDSNHEKNYFAFAAGSGITPIMSMIKSVLEKEPKSTFTLAYGNRNITETMFYEELEALKKTYPKRLQITYFFSQQNVEGCRFGRIDRSMVNFLLKNEYKGNSFDYFYLCGPNDMIDEIKNTLLDYGVDEKVIHFELFRSPEATSEAPIIPGQTLVTLTLDDETLQFSMTREKSILDAALGQGLDAPYSCKGGICSTCIARLKDGKVAMKKNMVLTDSELAENLILTCQSHPTTDVVIVDYDDV